MSEVPIIIYLYLSAFLLAAGTFVVLTKRNLIFALIGVELMLNASNLALVAFGSTYTNIMGQVYALFVVVIAVCEVSVALSVLLMLFKYFGSSDLKQMKEVGNE